MLGCGLATALATCSLPAAAADARLRTVVYDPGAVVTVPVRRGVLTHVVLADDESIRQVGAGLGGDCSKAESTWCIVAEAGDRNIFVKAKSQARAANNLAVVTDRRVHAFRFVVLADNDARQPVFRIRVALPAPARSDRATGGAESALAALPEPPPPTEIVRERLAAAPAVTNTAYAIAERRASDDIVPTLVFDDGRFTYLRFPGNREVPAVFHVLGDGSETLVNTRMEGDLLVVDRVSRRLMLRAGTAVVGVWNEAFDLEGAPPTDGTTVPGVARVMKAARADSSAPSRGDQP
ncbi:type IV secretion system protein VirB9 [Rubrivivax gelatinosus]|nr:type IV secretion system protein VirB9 [Rubrivivax gelatinosus]